MYVIGAVQLLCQRLVGICVVGVLLATHWMLGCDLVGAIRPCVRPKPENSPFRGMGNPFFSFRGTVTIPPNGTPFFSITANFLEGLLFLGFVILLYQTKE